MLKLVGRTVLVAGAYYVFGRTGLLLAIPPGYATAVWPASGIALAAVLLGGARLAPGIWLGSFLINVGTGFTSDSLTLALGLPAVIALGAALEALAGSWLIRRGSYDANPLAGGASVMRMLLLGGPVACLINASLGVGALWLAGKVPVESVPFNWWTWWIGDSIGVLLFTPLTLVWAARPWRTWIRRQVYVTAPLVMLFAVVVVLFVFISRREQGRIEAEFDARADDVYQGLRVRMNSALNVLAAVEGFYASSQSVKPYEFEIFAQRLVAHLDGVTALSWNPVVADAQRAAFEAQARRSGHADFRITERGENGAFVRAPRRDSYIPVETVVPRAGNELALGFNTASEPVRLAAMEQARDSGQAVASGRVDLIQSRGSGLLLMLPVYLHGAQNYQLEQRRRFLQGYAVAVFDLNGLIGDEPGRAAGRGLSLRLIDDSDPKRPTVMYGPATSPGPGLHRVFRFEFATRPWRLELSVPQQALEARRSWGVWFVLAGGLLLTGLLGILLLLGVGRTAHVQALVAERTEALRRTAAQLAHSNRELEQFAYVTSHDLKAPLRTIASFAELLGKRHGAKLEGEGREFLDFIAEGVRRMQDLIDDLLELSRVGSRKFEPVELPMRSAVDRACSALAADAKAGDAQIHVAELPTVHGDLHMLTQLWQNLIANAIKFRRPGQAPQIWIEVGERGADWVFSVRDNGIGIDARHLEQIFLVFRRLHTADQYPGTGIGLAICKKVVQMHGGEIWAESTPGQGACFRFSLPKAAPAPPG